MKKSSEIMEELLNYLQLSANKLASELELSGNTSIYYVKNGRNNLSPDLAQKIVSKFPEINYTWLLTGNGNMLDRNEVTTPPNQLSNQTPKAVPYYDVDFTAGFLEVTNNQQTQPDHYVTHPFFKGCDFIVRASGQSMAKLINHGDAIGLTKVEGWQDFLPMGEIYAIVTRNGFRMIKVVTKGDDDNHFTLISKPTDSKRDEFPPQQIRKDMILHIFKVQASSHLF